MAALDVLSERPSIGPVRPRRHALPAAAAGTFSRNTFHSKLGEGRRLLAILLATRAACGRPISTQFARVHAV